MSRRGSSRARYRCRPCSDRTGEVVYCAGHKCPVQMAPPSDVQPPDPSRDSSAIIPMQDTPNLSSSLGLDIFGLTDLSFPAPTVGSEVDFGTPLPLSPYSIPGV